MNALPSLAFALILAAAAVEAAYLFRRSDAADPVSHWLLLAAALALLAVTASRSIEMGFPALTGIFESLVFYALFACLVAFAYRVQRRIAFMPVVQFGATIVAAALLAIASSPIAPKEVLAPIPALRSGWLALHVAFSFVGEAFFVVSFVAALGFLTSREEERKKKYDLVTYAAVAVGYPIFTAGALVFGAIWAERAWGAWWSWDPKETWALVTWLVYTFYLHARIIRRRSGRLLALTAAIGFLCTVFTFLGVNFLLPGLHSY